MKLLHTSDWHVGKMMRGQSRAEEHIAVLAEITSIAAEHKVDLILVAGDLYETAAPGPESERIVYRALIDLAEVAPVLVVTGNHDNAKRLAAVDPLLALGRVTMVADAVRPDEGGLIEIEAGGVPVKVAMLPFVSQRSIVKADALMADEAYENSQEFAERMTRVIAALTARFDGDSVNLVCAHLFAAGGLTGGGERSAHTIFDYSVPALAFPATSSYVALGHLHRNQLVPGGAPIHYCGSPLQLDFGEETDAKFVNIVDAEPGRRAKVTPVQLGAGRQLATYRGSLGELRQIAESMGYGPDSVPEDVPWLRIRVTETASSGLADEVRAIFGPAVVDVTVESQADGDQPARKSRRGLSPIELFDAYCEEQEFDDSDVRSAFLELLEANQR